MKAPKATAETTTLTTIQVDPTPYLTLTKEADEAAALVATISGHPISCQADLDWLTTVGQSVKSRAKEVEALKKSATGPINAGLTAIRGWFKPLESQLALLEAATKRRVADYHRAAEEQRREAVRAATQTIADGAPALAQRAAIVAIPEPPRSQGVSVRKIWKYEVADPTLVPADYLSPDPAKLGPAVAAGVREIPGVRIWEDSQVAIRC